MTTTDPALITARLALATGDVSGASAACRNILEAVPNHAGALILLSEIAETAGQNDLARRFLKQLLRAHPNDGAHWAALSNHLNRTADGGAVHDLVLPS
ncbi:MAG: tetratricopeptide repeat protein, partial [Proteobacteria bacterium]|nr:tetratricopeptide repeat protein [Pseudomonadota bacterium]